MCTLYTGDWAQTIMSQVGARLGLTLCSGQMRQLGSIARCSHYYHMTRGPSLGSPWGLRPDEGAPRRPALELPWRRLKTRGRMPDALISTRFNARIDRLAHPSTPS